MAHLTRADRIVEAVDSLSTEALNILADALQGVSPAGWGIPTAFEDEGWTQEQYAEAFNGASDFLDVLSREG